MPGFWTQLLTNEAWPFGIVSCSTDEFGDAATTVVWTPQLRTCSEFFFEWEMSPKRALNLAFLKPYGIQWKGSTVYSIATIA